MTVTINKKTYEVGELVAYVKKLEKEIKILRKAAKDWQKSCHKAWEEKAELQEKLEDTEKARDYWKDSSFDWRHKCTSRKPFRVAVKAQKQLTEAKDIIRQLLLLPYANNEEVYADVTSTLDKAQQFIKE